MLTHFKLQRIAGLPTLTPPLLWGNISLHGGGQNPLVNERPNKAIHRRTDSTCIPTAMLRPHDHYKSILVIWIIEVCGNVFPLCRNSPHVQQKFKRLPVTLNLHINTACGVYLLWGVWFRNILTTCSYSTTGRHNSAYPMPLPSIYRMAIW